MIQNFVMLIFCGAIIFTRRAVRYPPLYLSCLYYIYSAEVLFQFYDNDLKELFLKLLLGLQRSTTCSKYQHIIFSLINTFLY